MTTEAKAQFAARLGVNKSTVTRWQQAGRLVMAEDGHVRVEESIERLRNTQGGRLDVAARHAEARPSGALPLGGDSDTAGDRHQGGDDENAATSPQGGADEGRARYKAILLHTETQQIKLEMALERGLRFRLEDAEREARAIAAGLRGALERLVDLSAPRLAITSDPAERRRILTKEIAALRRETKREFPRAMRRLTQ